MKYLVTLILVLTTTSIAFAQQFYHNPDIGIKVEIPEWLSVVETGNDKMWGGTFPAVEDIENALMITAIDKDTYKSFDELVETYITGNTFAQPSRFSETVIWYGYNPRDLYKIENGVSCRVFNIFEGLIYQNQFCLIETEQSYIWIQFVSTGETYDANIEKFNSFIESIIYLD